MVSSFSLVSLLKKDFIGKTTVSDCLRSGRTLPAAEVQRALADKAIQSCLDNSVLHFTNALVLSSLTKLKLVGEDKNLAPGASSSAATNDGPSSNYCFETVALACHWVQFLCEIKCGRAANKMGEENQSPQQAESTIDATQVVNMIKQILSSLSGVIRSLSLVHCNQALSDKAATVNDMEGDPDSNDLMDRNTTKHFDSAQVAAFAFAYILRLNHYVDEIPSLLTMVWKSLDEIAKAFLPSSQLLPPSLWTMAWKSLTTYFADGVQAMVVQMTQSLSKNPQMPSPHSTMQCKLIKYFVGRLSVYSQLSTHVRPSLFQPQRLSKLMMPLSLLMGMRVIWKQHTHQKQLPKQKELIEEYAKVFQKAEGLISFLFVAAESETKGATFTEALRLAVASVSNDALLRNDTIGPSHLHRAALFIGSLAMQLRLWDVVAQQSESRATQENSTHSLQICESILFTTLPGIVGEDVDQTTQAIINSHVPKILSSIVRTFVNTGCSAFTPETNTSAFSENFHFLLVSWLRRTERETCHPLSREILMTALCEYTEYFSESPVFLTFVIQLVFDKRTQDDLRDGLMDLIRRLAASKSTKDVVRRLVTEELATFPMPKAGGKRKRSRDDADATTAVLTSIVPILDLAEVALGSISGSNETVVPYGEMIGDKLASHVQTIPYSVVNSTTDALLQSIFYLASTKDEKAEFRDLKSVVDLVQTYSQKGVEPSLQSIALDILAAIGDSLQTQATKSNVESILQVFTSLLRNGSWPLRSQALSAFVNLATKIPQTYKGDLRECLPSSLLKAFQSRVKNASLYARLDIEDLVKRHAMSLPDPVPVDPTCLFPATGETIVEGSYIMKMPTVDGRSAMVVFPPDPASLSDIRYMLSSDDTGEEPVVHKIRRIFTHRGGCMLSLSRHK